MAKKVLIVDDEQSNIELFKEALEDEGFQVDFVLNGKEALDFLESDLPEVILLDLMMPVLDGFEVLKCLRADSRFNRIKTIVITGMAGTEIEKQVLGLGANHFFLKPVDIGQLIEEVEKN